MLLAPGLGDQLAVDQLVEQRRIDLGERQLLRLRRQALLRRLDIGEVQLDAVDAGDDGVCRRQRARRRRDRGDGGAGSAARAGTEPSAGGQGEAQDRGKQGTGQHGDTPRHDRSRGFRCGRTRPSMHIGGVRTSERVGDGRVGGCDRIVLRELTPSAGPPISHSVAVRTYPAIRLRFSRFPCSAL